MSDVIKKWHQLVAEQNPEGLETLLAENAVFYSPVVHTPQKGRAITQQYLTAAFNTLFNGTFRYVREIVGEKDALLEFELEMDGIQINGIDLISWNDQGQIDSFKVMIRPRKAMDTLIPHMMAALQKLGVI